MDFNNILESVWGGVKKYGFWVFILVALFFAFKRAWKWIVIPVLIMATIKQIALFTGSDIGNKIYMPYLIGSWAMILSIGGLFINTFFEKKKD